MGRGGNNAEAILYGRLSRADTQTVTHKLRGSRQAILLKILDAYDKDPSSLESLPNQRPTARVLWAQVVRRFIYLSAVENVIEDLQKRGWIEKFGETVMGEDIWAITCTGQEALDDSKYATSDWRDI